ncbi:MAG: putative N6-adenine-specific DNA methylase [Candidatus Marinamargulisbacteria bacterium]|jgi:putative N6-adenine-specific DNA methylase
MKVNLIATATMGLESVLGREVKALGFEDAKIFDGKVEYTGELKDICRSNLWLRTAGRIYIKMGQFDATTFDELFEKTKALPWSDWIPADGRFPVSKVTSRKSELFSKSDCQRIVNKAIAEHLKEAHGVQSLPEHGANFPIRIQIDKDEVILSMDSSGSGLNKRGYRAASDIAPLRETLAAGLLYLSHWDPERDVLLDPMCGSGTLLIEAGMMARNVAPGLDRTFGSEGWDLTPEAMWEEARSEAKAAIKQDAKWRIFGSDISGQALATARGNIQKAGLKDIFVQTLPLQDVDSRFERGKIVTNPPYGERLEEKASVEAIYLEMGKVFRSRFQDWKYYVLTAHEGFESLFGAKSTKNRKLYNGGIKCWFHQYF